MDPKLLVILQHEPDDPPGSIGTALRDLGVPFEVRRLDEGDALPEWPHETSGIIALGGAMHVTQTREHPFLAEEIKLMRRIVHEGGPVWGVCLGAQLLALAAGGDVYKRKTPEVGWVSIEKVADDPLLRGISSPFVAFDWHEYSCSVPATSHLIARKGDGVQAFRAGGNAWATQFHPEVDAALAPHWVRDAAKEQRHQGKDWIEQLRADTARYLPAYPAFCRTLTENFVRASGLFPADKGR
ncbi:MAG: gamma-glutamyl-gamma-aminobutyrate hydrolase family protein [Actinobacteria bacterium]|nr:gamma-glutamyl-gamma-aminobutyrate hydrolase family protein [Actinomycetota bacterium]